MTICWLKNERETFSRQKNATLSKLSTSSGDSVRSLADVISEDCAVWLEWSVDIDSPSYDNSINTNHPPAHYCHSGDPWRMRWKIKCISFKWSWRSCIAGDWGLACWLKPISTPFENLLICLTAKNFENRLKHYGVYHHSSGGFLLTRSWNTSV